MQEHLKDLKDQKTLLNYQNLAKLKEKLKQKTQNSLNISKERKLVPLIRVLKLKRIELVTLEQQPARIELGTLGNWVQVWGEGQKRPEVI